MEKKIPVIIKNVSFITTIFNEEKSIINFLKSLLDQNYLPSEIIIVDGGSRDDTIACINNFFAEKINHHFSVSRNDEKNSEYSRFKNEEIIQDFFLIIKENNSTEKENNIIGKPGVRIRLFSSPGSGIAEGRNIAINHASNEIICGSDGGCSFDRNWLYEITKYYFEDNKQVDVTGGFSHPVALTFLEKLLEICIMPGRKEINPEKFMPSSRNISFRKRAWQAVGGYPQHLDYGEDMKFNFNLLRKGFKIAFNPDAVVYWRMRESLVMIFRQFFRYSKGDAIGRMYTYRHLVRFFSLFLFTVLVIISIYSSPWFLMLFIPLILFYIYKPLLRVKDTLSHIRGSFKRGIFSIFFIMLSPFMLVFIDTAKALGYIYGKLKRKI